MTAAGWVAEPARRTEVYGAYDVVVVARPGSPRPPLRERTASGRPAPPAAAERCTPARLPPAAGRR
ncbi:MAG: hypothetical protein IPK42_08075 [Betaproteobacteria bacterium]|nr:hypothetical protein [Betaproteobacteria bacterium]